MPLALGQPPVARLPSVGPADRAPQAASPAPALLEKFAAVLGSALAAGDAKVLRQQLLEGLAVHVAADRVALGWQSAASTDWHVQITGQGALDRHSEPGRVSIAACAETALTTGARTWIAPLAAPLAYAQLASLLGARSVTGVPLFRPNHRPSAVLLVFDSREPQDVMAAHLAEIGPTLAGLAVLCDEATPSRLRILSRQLKNSLAGRKRLAALAASAIITLAACFPVSDRITCSATLEPSIRRFVGAPFDGKLEKALVTVGDAVAAGQTVALLDRRPLEIELSVHEAQLEEAAKRRDASRAKGQAAQAQLADLEVAQIERKIEQLEHQLGELTITSPIAGIVVRGELERAVGAPVSRGQSLFEIAPLSPLIAELGVPEDEVRLVAARASATIRPLALPGETLAGAIEQVHPRSEIRDGQAIFVAEVALPNENGQLRPGMQARAVIAGPRQPLAWTLVRRPLTRLYRAFWW